MKHATWAARWAAILLLAGGNLGCGFYVAYCDERMACEGGNENDVDACVVSLDADEDRAELWGCEDLWLERFECLEERSVCDYAQSRPDYTDHDLCRIERDRYSQCMHSTRPWW